MKAVEVINYVPLVALMVDFIINRKVIKASHIYVNILLVFIYFLGTYFGQLAMSGKPVYRHYLNWYETDGYLKPDWNKNWITIGSVFGGVIVFHMLFAGLAKCKSQIYKEKEC